MQKHGFAPIGAHFEEICSISAGNRCQLHKTVMHCLTGLPGDPAENHAGAHDNTYYACLLQGTSQAIERKKSFWLTVEFLGICGR